MIEAANEIWKSVVGHEGIYEVSSKGRVRSLDRIDIYARIDQYSGRDLTITRHHKGRVLRPGASKSGHLSVVLKRDAGSKAVHLIVLEAFVGPCPDGHECCHRDDVPSNNVLENLRWGTRGDNLRDAVRTGHKKVGEKQTGAKLKDADIPAIRRNAKSGSCAALARQYGVSENAIRQVRDKISFKHIPDQEQRKCS